MSLARKIQRTQAREGLRRVGDPKALARDLQQLPQALHSLRQMVDEAQTAVLRVLGELDVMELEARKQRAVMLRLFLDFVAPTISQEVFLAREEQYRAEYDAIFGIVQGLETRRSTVRLEEP